MNINQLKKMKARGEKIAWLTAYDYSFAALLQGAKVDGILVGDSLGMVVQGHDTPIPVTLADCVYHTRHVAAGAPQTMIIGDLPFGSYQLSKQQAYQSAVDLMRAGAQLIKLEGGRLQTETIDFLHQRGIAVCAHLGLTPQSVHTLGGFKVQGRDGTAEQLVQEALAVEAAGASCLVLEAIPQSLAKEISRQLTIPTIGIGAGKHCDGQVLVLYDMLGIYPRKPPKFSKNFLSCASSVEAALADYVRAVKQGEFPTDAHAFN